MSKAYEEAKTIIKKHVGGNNNDVLIFCGSGMTGAVNKLQRILGLRIPERLMDYMKIPPHGEEHRKDLVSSNNLKKYLQLHEALKPIVFVTHMEHNKINFYIRHGWVN